MSKEWSKEWPREYHASHKMMTWGCAAASICVFLIHLTPFWWGVVFTVLLFGSLVLILRGLVIFIPIQTEWILGDRIAHVEQLSRAALDATERQSNL